MAEVRITDEAALKTVEKYAKEKDIPATEAAARLIGVARSRLNATRKYAAEHPPKKAVKPAKVKAPAKPKKAKRPSLARAKPVQTAIPGTEPVAQ